MTNKKQKPKKEDSAGNDDELKSCNQAFFAFVFVLLMVGLPLWYETTKVYRANLPYEEISTLNETSRVRLKFHVNLIVSDDSITKEVEALRKSAESYLSKLDMHNRLTLGFKFSIEHMSSEYRTLLEMTDINEFDKSISNHLMIGRGLNIILIGAQKSEFVDFDLFLGRLNTFYCRWEYCRQNLNSILLDVFISRENLIDICAKHFDKKILHKDKISRKLADKPQSNYKMPLSPKYTVELALLFPDYDPNNRSTAEKLINFLQDDFYYLNRHLKNLSEIDFVSQSLYFVDFDQKPSYDRKLKQYFYDNDDLPRFISGVEPYLSSVSSDVNRETVHLLLYFPSKDKTGIIFGNPVDGKVETGFIVRNWGGVSIADLNIGNIETFEDVRSTILSQFRHLLGFYSPKSSKVHVTMPSSVLSSWDLQRLAIEAVLDYNFECVATLISITKLLSEITNIVINDHVADSIGKALISVKDSIDGLNSETLDDRTIGIVHQQAVTAHYHSEKAFFDESLLSLLYFPDDQKYAIYVPLFLPVLLPIVISIVCLVKRSSLSSK